MRANQINAPRPQTLAKGVCVRRLVINEARGLLAKPTAATTRHRHLCQGPLDQGHFRCGRRFQEVSQRNTLAVCHPHPLRTFALLGRVDARSPFLAGAKLPSAKVSAPSSCPWRSSCARKARHALSHTSCSSQRHRRRQQVLGEGKRSGGCPALVCCMTALSSARVTRSAFSYWPCFQEIPNGAVDTA